MRLILLGPPGSGKGTQAKLLCDRLNLVHISTGDILREAVHLKTPAGIKADPFLSKGSLAPDDLVNEMVADRFRRDDRPERFVMDGYPRTLAQAASFDQVLVQQFLDLTGVVLLLVPDDAIVNRLKDRLTCPNCKTPFHRVTKPPKVPGLCDECGTELIQRDDDKEATIRRRLKVYHESTAELIPHYRAQDRLVEVQGQGDVETIYSDMVRLLESRQS